MNQASSKASEYKIRPKISERVRPMDIKKIIAEFLEKKLKDADVFDLEEESKVIADELKKEIKSANSGKRYKYIVQIAMG